MPRKTISQGRGYAKYGWTKDLQSSEQEVYAKHLAFMKTEGSPALVQQFLQLIENYNKKFPNILSQYQ